MRKRRLYWTLQIAGWGFYASVNLFFLTINVLGQDENIIAPQQLEVVVQTPLLFLISHFVIRGISRKRSWVEKDFGRNIPRVVGLTLAAALFTTLMVRVIGFLSQTSEFNMDLVTQMLFDALAFFILYAVWATIYFLYHYLESYNKSLKYEATMNEMHLNQLKAQLNPHFIFNALNSMRALVDEEPAKAKVAITQLSNILRNSLIMDKKRIIGFNDELSTVKDYLALESIRFEERLRLKFDIVSGSERYDIPPMMIQTLVENAIKHGVSNLIEGGLVELSTRLDRTKLIITIRNSGQLVNGKRKKKKGGGYGLANTKERLKLIYGGEASFRIYNENDQFVVTEVKIPQKI